MTIETGLRGAIAATFAMIAIGKGDVLVVGNAFLARERVRGRHTEEWEAYRLEIGTYIYHEK
jgi:hypothetical protein